MKLLSVSKIDELTAIGFSIYVGNHGIGLRRFRDMRFFHHWGWSWENALYLRSPRWMLTIG